MTDTFETLTAVDALARFGEGSLSPETLVDDCLARIARDNPKVNAFTCVNEVEARRLAAESAQRWLAGTPLGPLDGIPVTIKDLTLTKGLPTRLGSTTTSPDGPWEVDAPISQHLRNAGAIVIGKTTSPEFGWKGVTDNPLHGITRNPWNPALTPGGSSGGAGLPLRLTWACCIKAATPGALSAYRAALPAPLGLNRPLAGCPSGPPAL